MTTLRRRRRRPARPAHRGHQHRHGRGRRIDRGLRRRTAARTASSSTPRAAPAPPRTSDPGATFISDIGGVRNYTGNLEDVFTASRPWATGCGFEQPARGGGPRARRRRPARAGREPGLPAPGRPAVHRAAHRRGRLLRAAGERPVRHDEQPEPRLAARPADATSAATSSATSATAPSRPACAPTGNATDIVTLDGCVSAEGAGMLTPVATLARSSDRSSRSRTSRSWSRPSPGRARRTPLNGGARAAPTPGHGR